MEFNGLNSYGPSGVLSVEASPDQKLLSGKYTCSNDIG
jgi:hypothetical protein